MCFKIIIFVISTIIYPLVADSVDLNVAKIIFYYGPNFTDRQIYELDEASQILSNPQFDSSKKTTFYIHGYLENQEYESIRDIVDAYHNRGGHNLLVLDWAKLVDGDYLTEAVVNYKRIGPRVADIFLQLFNSGLNVDKFHLVGHSLGGQLAGFVGRDIMSKSNNQITLPRISALDPAFPPFYFINVLEPISAKDADFVDIIHTDAWLYGAPRSGGDADFWPNGGKTLQPGCPERNFQLLTDNDLCSHRYSWRFWAESVSGKYENKFNAIKAWSWVNFKIGRYIRPSNIVLMGIDCSTNATGNYYLTTNGNPPYARGLDGLKYP